MLRYNDEQIRATGPAGVATHIAAGSNFEEVIANRPGSVAPAGYRRLPARAAERYPGQNTFSSVFRWGYRTDNFGTSSPVSPKGHAGV